MTEPDTEVVYVKDSEKLALIFILCDICKKQDRVLLNRFVYIVSRNIESEEFDDILRRTMKIMGKLVVRRISCQDWLINELFAIYKNGE